MRGAFLQNLLILAQKDSIGGCDMMTKEEMKKKVEELEETKAQMMGNINFVNGQISLLKEMIDPPKET